MRSAQAGRIVHALLFTGPKGTGKKSMAEIFARSVLCTGERKPCDVCPACKKVLGGIHPDVHYVTPEKNTIKVEQIRDLTEKLALSSYEGGRKIAVIHPADAMNESAQNALLKTLENPTGDTLFFLLTDAPGTLLPTIVSRCLQVRFSCLEMQTCASVLTHQHGIAAEEAKQLAYLAQGSVGRALEIHADGEYLPLRDRLIAALEGIQAPADVAAALSRMGEMKGREETVLEIMELWARDLMRSQNGALASDLADAGKIQTSKYSGSMLLKRIVLARQQLHANLSWANVLESLAFDLARARS